MIHYHDKNIKKLYKGDYILPEEYQEVEYIKGTGNDTITLNIYPNDTTITDIDFSFHTDGVGERMFGCGSNSSDPTSYYVLYQVYSQGFAFRYAGKQYITNTYISKIDQKINMIFGKNTYIDGKSIFSNTTASFTSSRKFNIFHYTSGTSQCSTISIYRCNITHNGELIARLIPCYRKEDGKSGFYNLIDNTFYTNTSKRIFEYGEEVHKKVKFILKDNRVIYADESLLPNEYRRVKYIESHGNQYIDTNFIPNGNTTTFCSYIPRKFEISTNSGIYGARVSSTKGNYSAVQGGGDSRFFNVAYLGYNDRAIILDLQLSIDNTVFIYQTSIGGNYKQLSKKVDIYYTKADFTSGYTMYVFSINQDGKNTFNSCIKMNILYCLEDNNMKLYIIPVVRNSDNKPGMYDLVTNTFFTNEGTGEFTWEELDSEEV